MIEPELEELPPDLALVLECATEETEVLDSFEEEK